MADDELLDLRFKDLPITLDRTPVLKRVDRLLDELAQRGLEHFRPHVWLSTEWFTPDGVPGIAIPFYLAHPRLTQLEKQQMYQAEGHAEDACLRILRHEAGHAIDNAYRLHRRKGYREHFGRFGEKYPDTYQPKPYSKKYVYNLRGWYAQAHPAEDFAETFAVWLKPRSRWRQEYKGWPAIKKLEYMHELMAQIADEKPAVKTTKQVEPVHRLTTTLRDHYRERRAHYGDEWPDFYDNELRRLFSEDKAFRHRETAAAFLKQNQAGIRDTVARWTGVHPYTIDQVLLDMADRCKELRLRLCVPAATARTEVMIMITVQTMHYLQRGYHRVAL